MINLREILLILIKRQWFMLIVIVLLGLSMRLYRINSPLIESHQVRQAQTAVMARNLYEDGMNIFRTRLDFFGQTPGYVILEFPLMHGITALFYYLFGVHDIIGRLVSLLFSIGAMILMYMLARQFLSIKGALAAVGLYVFSPMNIFFSRAFMPESSMLFFIIGAFYFFLKWLNTQRATLYVIAIMFAELAFLTKPTAAIIFIPIFTAWFLKGRWVMFRSINFWLYAFLAIIPGLLWALYANYFNSRLPYSTYSFGDSWILILKTRGIIRHWFSLKFYSFLGGSIVFLLLTPLGFIGTIIGALNLRKDVCAKILYSWIAAIVAYFYFLAGPNSGHIYYHLQLLPLASILFGYSIEWFMSKKKIIKRIVFGKRINLCLTIFLIILVLVSYSIGYFQYFKYMYSNRMPYVLEVSEIIKKNTPGDRLIIDNGSGLLTSVISYYSHSKVQPFCLASAPIGELEKLRKLGATTFVTMETSYGSSVQATRQDKEFWEYLNKNYKAIAINEHYIIFDIRTPLNKIQ